MSPSLPTTLWGLPVRIVDNPLTRRYGFYFKGASMDRDRAREVIKEGRDLIEAHVDDTDSDEFNDAFDELAPILGIAVLTLLLSIDKQVHREGV